MANLYPPLPLALTSAVTQFEPIKGKVANIGMLREANSVEYIWHISFVRISDGQLLNTYVSAPRHEIEQNTYDPEAELMEIFQLAIYEAMVNG